MDSTEIAIRSEAPKTIQEYNAQTDLAVDRASYWAKALMKVVDQCRMSATMGGKKYLETEAWLMIAEFAHTKAIIEWVHPWLDPELNLIGYEARCRLVNDNGEEVGAGESSCGLDAFPCRGKQGSERDKAAKSAAQTWAISRALRNKFSYVARIAGYEPAPAEEVITHGEQKDSKQGAGISKQPERAVTLGTSSATLATSFGNQTISDAQAKRLFAICKQKDVAEAALREKMQTINPLWVSTRQITRDAYDGLCAWAEAGGRDTADMVAATLDDDVPDFEVPDHD